MVPPALLPTISGARRRTTVAGAVVVLLLVAGTVLHLGGVARGSDVTRCQQFRSESLTRASAVTGSGERVVVIGDSWSAGLGLGDSTRSWPSRLPGRVAVAGFSGSGFSERASSCGRVSFADRAATAVRHGADLVLVEGGLNDVDQPDAAIVSGFDRLMTRLAGRRVVVVGPAAAPSRAARVHRVDSLLARLSEQHGVAYVETDDLRLSYLPDRLHLTPAGHRAFGDAVAERVAALTAAGATAVS